MGASDWAGRTVQELVEAFGISDDRALRITTLVRMFVSDPTYDAVFADHGTDQWAEQKQRFIDDLPRTLKAQPGDTVEARWNTLMDARDIPNRTDEPVYLKPWPDIKDKDPMTTSGYTAQRPTNE